LSPSPSGDYRPFVETILERARWLADEVLFPGALLTDAADLVPKANLDVLAREGFYGMAAPLDAGGVALDLPTSYAVVEALASGCLTTTFVWLQHRNPVRAVQQSSTPGLRQEWLESLCRGEKRAGIALAANRPGPPLLRASIDEDRVVLDGEAPWVSGWGRIDVMLVTARDGEDVVSVLADAREGATLAVEHLRLVGANASGTVTLRFRDHEIAASRIVSVEAHSGLLERDATGLRMNGCLALGVASRCCTLIGPGILDNQLATARKMLDEATRETLPAARAGAAELAMRATAALITSQGSRSILADQHAQRLAREAMFLLVFGSRPAIREDLLRRLLTVAD
jgi:alkylation response protein AidB-like acyl-CoA dehydrogenase